MVRPKAHCLLFEVCLTSDFHFQNSSKHSREKLRTFACINTQGNWHLKLLVGLSWCGQNLCVNFLWVLFPLPRSGGSACFLGAGPALFFGTWPFHIFII